MFAPFFTYAYVYRDEQHSYPKDGWAYVTNRGEIFVHPTRLSTPEEWSYILAHCLLHLGLGHFQREKITGEWNGVCDCYIAKFLADMKLGKPPFPVFSPVILPRNTEELLYQHFCHERLPDYLRNLGTAGEGSSDMLITKDNYRYYHRDVEWQTVFGKGLSMAVRQAVSVAGGYLKSISSEEFKNTPAQRARGWFISSYPLLGALAADFRIIEDPIICQRMDISIAAVDEEAKEIYINPAAGLTEKICQFVIAHELLHVGLRHQGRCHGRDPYLWNVACDFVINGWLVEMGLGDIPEIGGLYDPELNGLSAESIYDRIVIEMRRFRRLATLRGVGLGDIILGRKPGWEVQALAVDLDNFYRNCLNQGLVYHQEQGRGYLPAGFIEEIHALSHPPIAWDVELAQWFDDHFSPIEKRRTYSRLSRRQSSTPDIPRPKWTPTAGAEDGRTYAVILDTSGSMDRKLLAKALGAIASYSISRDVPAVRVVFCDATAYDQGYMRPEDIIEHVKIKGRGGTILQPGIDLVIKGEDFPKDGPILIITDGRCDKLTIPREHAFLIPRGYNLPFVPKGKVFRIE